MFDELDEYSEEVDQEFDDELNESEEEETLEELDIDERGHLRPHRRRGRVEEDEEQELGLSDYD